MKAADVLTLDQAIKRKKTDIQINRRSRKVLAEELSAELGFKVGVTALGDVLMANGIEIKGARDKRRIDALMEENESLRGMLAEILPHETNAPQHLIERIRVALAQGEKLSLVG